MDNITKPITKIPFSDFIQVHQYKTINANKEGQIYYFLIPQSTIGFIYNLGNNWFNNTTANLIIDGNPYLHDISRIIGDIDQPSKINPPICVKNYIEWYVYNNDSTSHNFEALIDGILISKRRD